MERGLLHPELSPCLCSTSSLSASLRCLPRLRHDITVHAKHDRWASQPKRSLLQQRRHTACSPLRASSVQTGVDVKQWVAEDQKLRHEFLEEQALRTLRNAAEGFEMPAFPCALIAGDVVILNLLDRLGHLKSGRVAVIFIDTFHLFPETYEFLERLEAKYGFKAQRFHAKDFADKAAYRKVHGSDLYITDVEGYDRICKVEPFNRSLQLTGADCMINGRRRDHGADRAHLQVFEEGKPLKCNPLAWWEFRDCMDYLQRHGLERHPLHDEGFPSIGDVHSTVPVPEDKWYEYGGERSGRFQGMTNPDGSAKTECGIHVPGQDEATGMSNIRR